MATEFCIFRIFVIYLVFKLIFLLQNGKSNTKRFECNNYPFFDNRKKIWETNSLMHHNVFLLTKKLKCQVKFDIHSSSMWYTTRILMSDLLKNGERGWLGGGGGKEESQTGAESDWVPTLALALLQIGYSKPRTMFIIPKWALFVLFIIQYTGFNTMLSCTNNTDC